MGSLSIVDILLMIWLPLLILFSVLGIYVFRQEKKSWKEVELKADQNKESSSLE